MQSLKAQHTENLGMIFGVNPLIALGVLASTAATDAAYVFFNAAVTGRRRVWAANWSAIWYLLSAFAVISYTENAITCYLRRRAHGLTHSPR
jgi:hypothetical protein